MGRKKPGKPSRVRTAENEGTVFFLPMKHICGCYLSWGIAVPPYDEKDRGHWVMFAGTQIEQFLRANHAYPCPMHGSASGVPSAPLMMGETRYVRQSNAWYMACPPDDYDKAEERAEQIMALGSLLYYPDGSPKEGPPS